MRIFFLINKSNSLLLKKNFYLLTILVCFVADSYGQVAQAPATGINSITRQRISINEDWRFYKYDSVAHADNLIYDVRPRIRDNNDARPADAEPTEPEDVQNNQMVLKPWILPTGNDFIKDTANYYIRPEGNPGSDFPFVQNDFDDHMWESVNLPHDWAIKGPFIEGWDAEVGGGNGYGNRG